MGDLSRILCRDRCFCSCMCGVCDEISAGMKVRSECIVGWSMQSHDF